MSESVDSCRCSECRLLGCLILFSCLLLLPMATPAEELQGSNVDQRVILALKVDQAELARWIPAPWSSVSLPAGPMEGANLYVMLVDRLLHLDPQGTPVSPAAYRVVSFAAPAVNRDTGEVTSLVLRVYAPHEEIQQYNPYRNSRRGRIVREHSHRGENTAPLSGGELWQLTTTTGGSLRFSMEYQGSAPMRQESEVRPRSAVAPDFYRIYRSREGVVLLRSVPLGVDRVTDWELSVTLSEFAPLFDGSEELIGVVLNPWYIRDFFLPSPM